MKNRTKLITIVMTTLLIFSSLVIVQVLGADNDSATGSVTVGNSTPQIESAEYVDSTYGIVTNYDVGTSIFGVNVTITDSNTMADLDNVTFFLFDESVHGDSGGNDWDTALNTGNTLINISWIESTDTWTLNQGSFTEWSEQTSIDPGSASALTVFEFTARFNISRAAYAATDWNVTVVVYDDAGATNTTAAPLNVELNSYFEIEWAGGVTTFDWGTVSVAVTNKTMETNYTLNIWANALWEIQLNASDFLSGGESDVDVEANNIIMWSETEVEGTDNSSWVRNTRATMLGNWDQQAAMPSETAISRDIHLWFTDPTGLFTSAKIYESVVQMLLQANT